MENEPNEIIPPYLAVKAMRDSGFKTSAHAIAELIDNSIQAGASTVEVFCFEELVQVNERNSRRITAIGVLDDGCGMTPETLLKALQFGNGTHLQDRNGIGRFGMGLPNSSISQCRKVEVWTWQNSHQNAIYSYLDVNEIENQNLDSVPEPVLSKIPDEYVQLADDLCESGTLVLWTGFEENRLSWKQAQTIFKYTEFIIGRMYRKFIDSDRIEIRMHTVLSNEKSTGVVRVNDPLYLTERSSTPKPFDNKAMFQRWQENDEVFEIQFRDKISEVKVRMSWASEETLPDDGYSNRGRQDYGKHAERNIGVSIIREGRELDLDRNWAINYDPTERWWGVEVEFPAILDEIFGVTNNKQSALIFSQMANFNWREEAEPNETRTDFCERIKSQDDPRFLLLPIAEHIKTELGKIRKNRNSQTEGRRTKRRIEISQSAENKATEKFNKRAEEGHIINSDEIEPKEEHHDAIKTVLMEDQQYSESDADQISRAAIKHKLKVLFVPKELPSLAFFDVKQTHGGITTIEFNMKHPLFEQLFSSLNLDDESADIEELKARIYRASDTLKLLLASWARYEKEESNGKNFIEYRKKWGKMAKHFLTEQEDAEDDK